MKRITIDITKDELNFIREAIESKVNNLKIYLNTCEEAAREPEPQNELFGDPHPYGTKKDGTPAKKRGRPAKRRRS